MTGAARAPLASTGDESSVELAVVAARAADDKLGSDSKVLEVGPVLGIADYFVITSGTNDRQVKAISEAVESGIAAWSGRRPLHVEGVDARQWILLDYGDVVVHVFLDEIRQFYGLDRLWSDVGIVDWIEA